jgi:cell division protein FtsZ
MIQIKSDISPLERIEPARNIALIGLGGAGVNILDQLALRFQQSVRMIAIDSDRQVIAGSAVAEKHLLGAIRCRGLGCGGDPDFARELVAQDLNVLEEILGPVEQAILLVGVGGGTGSGASQALAEWLRERGVRVVVLAVTPFSFEAKRRMETAVRAVADLRQAADAVMVLSNDRLTRHIGLDQSVQESFRMMNEVVGQAGVAITHLLGKRALMQLSLADLQTLVGREFCPEGTEENCWVGLATGRGADRHRQVVEQALTSPLFADAQAWREGERMVVSILGGRDFTMAEFQKVQQLLQAQMPKPIPFVAGAATDDARQGYLQVAIFVARSDPAVGRPPAAKRPLTETKKPAVVHQPVSPVALPAPEGVYENGVRAKAATKRLEGLPRVDRARERKVQRYFAHQEELPFESVGFRGRFEKSLRSEFDGRDLDQPTFQRLRVAIRL